MSAAVIEALAQVVGTVLGVLIYAVLMFVLLPRWPNATIAGLLVALAGLSVVAFGPWTL